MNNKQSLILFFCLGVITLLSLIAWLYEKYNNNHFSCTTHLTVYKGKLTMNVDEHYTFNGGTGVVESSGTFISADGVNKVISRKSTFSYIKRGSEYTLLSDNAAEDRTELVPLRAVVPDFYMLSNRGLTMTIQKQQPNGYIFVMGDIPLYYCQKD